MSISLDRCRATLLLAVVALMAGVLGAVMVPTAVRAQAPLCNGKQATITTLTQSVGDTDVWDGGPGDDVIIGLDVTGRTDAIDAGGGDDTICTRAGSQARVVAGAGKDYFDAGTTDSTTVLGGPGDDTLNGGGDAPLGQSDELAGDAGQDILNGLGGNDFLSGGGGADELNGGDGPDVLCGDTRVLGDALAALGGLVGELCEELPVVGGADRLFGGRGDDELNGGALLSITALGVITAESPGPVPGDTGNGGEGNDRCRFLDEPALFCER